MAQHQVNNGYGFTSCTLQLDGNVAMKICNIHNPQIEFQVRNSKITLDKKQWQILQEMVQNINLAFSLVESGVVSVTEESRKKEA